MLKAVIHSLMLGLDFRLETIAGEVFGGAVVRSLAMLSVFGTSEFQAFVNPPKHRILCIIRYRHVGRFPQRRTGFTRWLNLMAFDAFSHHAISRATMARLVR